MAKQLAALVIEDVPGDVQIQIDRQEFVEKKLIFCAADDQIEVPNADADDGDAHFLTPRFSTKTTRRVSGLSWL